MLKSKKLALILSVAIVLLTVAPTGLAETWRLEPGQGLTAAASDNYGKYQLQVARIKQLINSGQTTAVSDSLVKLKQDFPEIAGPDLDAFIKVELLFTKGKFAKAARSYDKLLTNFSDSELYYAALDRQFAIATAFLAGRKTPILKFFRIKGYASGQKLMEKIIDRAGDTPIAVKASLSIAKSLEKRQEFSDAYHQWSIISSRWPTGQLGKDALLAMARCKHAAYKGPKYDASTLISAKSYYEDFKLRYPADSEKLEIGKKLEQINEQLAYKQFNIGSYYQQTGSEEPANFYYKIVRDGWPNSTAAKMIARNSDQ